MIIGTNMRKMLTFIRKVNGWHTYANNRATVNAINSLKRLHLIETNQFNQFRTTTHRE